LFAAIGGHVTLYIYILYYIYFLGGKSVFKMPLIFLFIFSPQIRACLCTRMKSTLYKKCEFCCPLGYSDSRWVLPLLFVLMHCNLKFVEISPCAKRKFQLVSLHVVMPLDEGIMVCTWPLLVRASSSNGLSRGVISLHLNFRLQGGLRGL
jgi:hypothetical protein